MWFSQAPANKKQKRKKNIYIYMIGPLLDPRSLESSKCRDRVVDGDDTPGKAMCNLARLSTICWITPAWNAAVMIQSCKPGRDSNSAQRAQHTFMRTARWTKQPVSRTQTIARAWFLSELGFTKPFGQNSCCWITLNTTPTTQDCGAYAGQDDVIFTNSREKKKISGSFN